MGEIRLARGEIGDCLSGHRYRAGIERLMKLSQRGNQFFAEETPWKSRKTDMEACARTMLAALRMVEALSVLMMPFLPFAAGRLREMLKLPMPGPGAWDAEPVIRPGQELGTPEVLFPKMEPDAIRPFEEALEAARQA
jgi:methionyl-tRNA synthetase